MPSFLAGGGEMGALMRAYDWSATPLGVPENWPKSLKTAIRIMLTSRQPIWIGWGQELIFFYNDAYRSIIGGKHPHALGRPTSVVWQEIWTDIGPMLATAMTGIEGTYVEEQLLIMERSGYPEETYYTFSYSPIPNDDDSAGGIICANTDDTKRVIGERQLMLLRETAAATVDARSWREACERSARSLAADPYDIPFAMLYVADPEDGRISLAGSCGIDRGHQAAPETADEKGQTIWPLGGVLNDHQLRLVEDLSALFDADLPTGAWPQPPSRAAVLPILPSGETGRAGVLVVGLNPFRLFDENYEGFLNLLAGQMSAAIANAQAYEDERRRAEALAEIDRAKTIFFSNISHEFRTPLTLMLGPLEELMARPQDDAATNIRPLVEVTHRNGLRLLKLVNTLLDFSRIEAGRIQISYTSTDLATFTSELASSFRSAMEKAGLIFRVDCEPLPEPVYVDRDMWEKVVLNLLSNAFKFTFEGEVSVTIRPSQNGRAAELVVADTGTGVPPEELPRLFDRFHRVEGARGRTIEGSGIGLALVEELVKLHGGTIGVESTIGRGSAFTVTLPFGTAHLAGEHIVGEEMPASTSLRVQSYVEEALRWLPGNQGSDAPVDAFLSTTEPITAAAPDKRILVVDDNADLRDYLCRLLNSHGYQVEAAADGAEALEIARRSPPNLVLSDVMMPHLDGFGLLRELRADPALREIPVLLLSARAGEEARVEGLEAGADDYLTKPFSTRELVARVSSNLQLAHIRRETEQKLREEAHTLEVLNRVGTVVAAELDLGRAVQIVTDAATELTGAAFGSFFYNVIDRHGESYMLYTLSGVPREAFSKFPMPRNTSVFAPTFLGEGIVRSDDITKDPRYGKNDPHFGMPKGHLPVCSYLAAPVVSRSGEVLGGLFFGHPEAGIFTERAERILIGIAAQAAIAIDNARLYQAAQSEIGERKKAEAALRELNDTLEQRVTSTVAERDRLWDLSEDLLVVADHQGRLLRVSPSWSRVLGYDRYSLLTRRFSALVHPDDVERMSAVFEGMWDRGHPVHHENQVRTADGNWRWISWTLSPDPGSDLVHGVGRDVTADKEAALAVKRAEEALRVAQKMEAVGKLTGGVAHDFNNLLQVIGGNLQLLARDLAGNEKAERRVRNALAGVSRGSKLAAQLLAFGRRQPLAPKVVNLGRFVRGLDDMLRRALGDGIEIETVIAGGLWNTLVDPSQVENALLNLAINARDAMNGHGKLTIEAGNASLDDLYTDRHADVSPGQYVMLAVTDTGCGIPAEVMEHVFEPFFTTKPEGQGTGLGLSMVYGFVKQSDGHIKIYSEPGHGTTVRLYLPRVRQEEDVATEIEAGPVTGGTETVLVVEDDEEVRTTVVEMLVDFGYRVLKARDAQNALAIIESGMPVDLLFTDVVMPGPLRSPVLAKKARERLPNIAVLFTSGYTDNAIVHGGRLDEGIELLSKPYTREALARKIRHVLRNQQQRAVDGKAFLAKGDMARPDGLTAGAFRILLVEDDDLVCATTSELLVSLGHSVVAATNAADALRLLASDAVDVLLTDIALPEMSGLELAQKARDQHPELYVVFASGQDVDGKFDHPNVAQLRKPYDAAGLVAVLSIAPGRKN
ncbi:response regulator [Dongia soli]|uniref:histidine kinase n=1 Tax=Dongia soli TaxID=600628 RepID=A0ABU5EDA1_9PROT|nr:response regulator [Dongia soli]MDY0883535.1 response regulator [Dongia soli]